MAMGNTIDAVKLFFRVGRPSLRIASLSLAGLLFLTALVFLVPDRNANLHATATQTANVPAPRPAPTINQKEVIGPEVSPVNNPDATELIETDASANVSSTANVNPCTALINRAQQAYNQEIKKEKALLDSKLSFPVGITTSSGFVNDYNEHIADIFEKYSTEAKSSSCELPIKQPVSLPLTYHP
jgi:hypothetical protein